MKKALSGVKVIDLTRVLAGPFCTMMLADMGAEVVKIERPKTGDDSRAFGPFLKGESAYFMCLNRNKKSIVLDLKSKEDIEIFKRLIAKADVVVENFRPGTMEKLGIGYEELKKVNPGIIYAACSGFGHSGPYSKKPAYDSIIQAMSGLMSITGQPEGIPTRVGASIADIIAGMYTAFGILAALYFRQVTGVGQKVDVAMFDSVVSVLENAVVRYFVTGEVPTRIGNRHPSIAPFTSYKTKDDYIIIAVGNDRLWEAFCRAVGRPDLLQDERFKTNKDRSMRWALLDEILGEVLKNKTTEEWIQILEEAGVPCGPINTIDKVVKDPQLLARDMIVKTIHSVAGELLVPGISVKLSETPGKVETPAPLLGEHTEEVLRTWLGYKKEQG
jgi:CoA:oxalate CoA-transferase